MSSCSFIALALLLACLVGISMAVYLIVGAIGASMHRFLARLGAAHHRHTQHDSVVPNPRIDSWPRGVRIVATIFCLIPWLLAAVYLAPGFMRRTTCVELLHRGSAPTLLDPTR